MEWKEHVAWLAPIAATVVAFVVTYYGPSLASKVGERRALMIFFFFGLPSSSRSSLLNGNAADRTELPPFSITASVEIGRAHV